MYNRYVPQSDGSFLRSRIPEPEKETVPGFPEPSPVTKETVPIAPQQQSHQRNRSPSGKPTQMRSAPTHYQSYPAAENAPGNVGSFLKGLLPKNFDTEDLIVVLLLLLISGNSAKDQNAAIMTLGIYLFL